MNLVHIRQSNNYLYFTLPGSFHMEWDAFHMDYIFIPYGLYAHSIWNGIHSIWTRIHSIWTRIHSIWTRIHSIWTGIHSIWTGIHSIWTGIHSIWTIPHSIWIPGGLLDNRNGENKIILIHSNTSYFI